MKTTLIKKNLSGPAGSSETFVVENQDYLDHLNHLLSIWETRRSLTHLDLAFSLYGSRTSNDLKD